MSTVTTSKPKTRSQSSVFKPAPTKQVEMRLIKIKHSAPLPRDLLVSSVNSRQASITFMSIGDPDHPSFNLRIHTITAGIDEPFGEIFAKYRHKAKREIDILSFWRRDARDTHPIWPNETPREVFEYDDKQVPGSVEGVADEWKIEVKGWRARGA